MTPFLAVICVLLLVFAVAWHLAPRNTLTAVQAVLATVWQAMGEILDSLAGVDWAHVMPREYAVLVGALLGVSIVLSRFRGRLRPE